MDESPPALADALPSSALPGADGGSNEAGEAASAEPVPEPGTAAAYYAAGEAPPLEEIPPGILEDFQRGTASISDERRELMEKGREEMPDHVRRDFEEAASPEIPSAVLADFEDPYQPMPAGHEKYFPGGVKQPERPER